MVVVILILLLTVLVLQLYANAAFHLVFDQQSVVAHVRVHAVVLGHKMWAVRWLLLLVPALAHFENSVECLRHGALCRASFFNHFPGPVVSRGIRLVSVWRHSFLVYFLDVGGQLRVTDVLAHIFLLRLMIDYQMRTL